MLICKVGQAQSLPWSTIKSDNTCHEHSHSTQFSKCSQMSVLVIIWKTFMRKIFLRPFWVLPITPHKSLLHWFLPTPVCWQGWKGFQSFLRLIYSHLVLKTIRGWGWDPGEACTTVYAYSSGKKENSPPNLCRKSWAWQFSGVVCEVVQGHGMLYILCTWCVYFLYRLPFPNVTIARLHWG